MHYSVCPQSVLHDVLKLKLLDRMLQKPLQLAPAVLVIRAVAPELTFQAPTLAPAPGI